MFESGSIVPTTAIATTPAGVAVDPPTPTIASQLLTPSETK
jgi:hypothetical protein